MPDTMTVEEYLAEGGVLTSPANVPPRYRGELMRMMATFVDSELAAAAGFADTINHAPGIKPRISAARIVLEKTDHAERVLSLMGEFGADTARYAVHHPWAERVDRETDIGKSRHGTDMRLSVFHYPLQGWVDAVVMNVLMGLATGIQLGELSRVSYGPLAEQFREITPREAHHTELGLEGLAQIVATDAGRAEAGSSIAYWKPRVAATFGAERSVRFDMLKRLGLRYTPNEQLKIAWQAELAAHLTPLGVAA